MIYAGDGGVEIGLVRRFVSREEVLKERERMFNAFHEDF